MPNTSIETAVVPVPLPKPNGATEPLANTESDTVAIAEKLSAKGNRKARRATVAKAVAKGKGKGKAVIKAKGKGKTRAKASHADLKAIAAKGLKAAVAAKPAFRLAMNARRSRAKANGGTYTGGGAPLPDLPRDSIVTVLNRKAFLEMGARAKGVRTGQTVNAAVQVGMKGFHGRRRFLRKALYAGFISVAAK